MRTVMSILVWLVLGGLIGWMASLIMRADAQQEVLLNVVVGIVGAALGGWFLSPFVGVSATNQSTFDARGLLVAFLGAAVLLWIANLIRRSVAR